MRLSNYLFTQCPLKGFTPFQPMIDRKPPQLPINVVLSREKSNTGVAMKMESNEAWNLFVASRLMVPSQLNDVAQRVEAELADLNSSPALLDWLQNQRLITPYQSRILAAGQPGPFIYGDYVLTARIDQGPLTGTYAAIHRLSGHPVFLDFFHHAELDEGRMLWRQIATNVQKASGLKSNYLIATYEAVELPDFAFVVSERPSGSPLMEKIPKKARLPWQSALLVVNQIASALQDLDSIGMTHGTINPRSIWLEGKLKTRLRIMWRPDPEFAEVDPASGESQHDYQAPEVLNGLNASQSSDVFSLGCLLVRLITGRTLTGRTTIEEKIEAQMDPSPPDLSKYGVPQKAVSILAAMLDKKPENRPSSLREMIQEFAKLSGKELTELEEAQAPESLVRFEKFRAANEAFFSPREILSASSVNIATPPEKLNLRKTSSTPVDLAEHQKIVKLRRRKQWLTSVGLLAGTMVLSLFVIFLVSLQTYKPQQNGQEIQGVSSQVGSTDQTSKGTDVAENDRPLPPNAVIHQFPQDDDGQLLWESPTIGPKFSFEYLPVNPRLIFIFRPADLMNMGQAELAMQALSPELKASIDQWLTASGLELTDIKQLVVALYPLDDSHYSPLNIVYLNKDVPKSSLVKAWNATPETLGSDKADSEFLVNAQYCFLPIPMPDNAEKIAAFVMGPKDLVVQAGEMQKTISLEGSFAELAPRVDASRHLNILFMPIALFNQQGQQLMGELWSPVNRQLYELTDPNIRGGIFSVHFDDSDCYLELTLDHTADIKDRALVEVLKTNIALGQNKIIDAAVSLLPNTYWNRVRVRFDNMVDGILRNTRLGGEAGFVIVNCWAPSSSIHNLLASCDLALRFAGTGPVVQVAKPNVPQTIEQLLATKRSLSVTTNPDLNILLQNLAAEVNTGHKGMPFTFEIEIAGNDLVRDGITQNQRPGDFEIKDSTLDDILTQIMFRANSDKSATGPNDAKCKLVWVLLEDATQPGKKKILITTRSAASERNLELPSQFRVENN